MRFSTLGFPPAEASKLGKILPLAKNRHYSLHAFDPTSLPDAVLIFGEADRFPDELAVLKAAPSVKIVVVAKQAPGQGDYVHIPFPLVASRVLRVLEGLAMPSETATAFGQTQPLAALPIAPDTAAPLAVSLTAPLVILEDEGKPLYKVLVVDDSLPMQKALALELEKLAATVLMDFSGSGEEALEKTADKEYDFIFLDIMMPGIDGFETCAQMRKRPTMKKVPIIMLSAKTSPLDEVKGVISGCTTYLMKPIVHEEFQKVVSRITKWVDNFNARGQDAGV